MKLVHKNFQLNGQYFLNSKEIIEFSQSISKEIHAFLKDWFSEEDYVLVETSGSTGTPKTIQLQKDFMINSALATGTYFDLPKKTTALCCLPIGFIAGKMMLVRAMILGWHLDVIEPNSYPLESIDKEYDFSAMVPLQLSNSLEKINFIKRLIVGGGVVSEDLQDAIQKVTTEIYATYGMTETITHIAVRKLNNLSSLRGNMIKQSHYVSLPNVSISKDDRNCLIINAPKVSQEKVITNDVVEIISENKFIWKGRYDNVVNSGGIKLHPEEIEKKLSLHIKAKFFVAGIPDEKLGEKLILIIEGKENSVILKEVRNLKTLSKFEVPKETFFVKKFIETETGKIQRAQILQKIRF
jgi:O-succinylbenzoic acid--CoA ligase